MGRLSPAAVRRVEEICERHLGERTPLIVILSDIQREFGCVPLDVQMVVSRKTGISVAEIYGVVTFYSFFKLRPSGKYVIGVCLGTACYVKGSQNVMDQFQEDLGIGVGETTEDGLFSIDGLRCIGACASGPAVTINGKIYAHVAPKDVAEIIAQCRNEEARRLEEVQANV